LAANQRVQRGLALECCARGEIEVWRRFGWLEGFEVSAHSAACGGAWLIIPSTTVSAGQAVGVFGTP
jgi:hypothetical protein